MLNIAVLDKKVALMHCQHTQDRVQGYRGWLHGAEIMCSSVQEKCHRCARAHARQLGHGKELLSK